jgi:ferrous iron transport protein B
LGIDTTGIDYVIALAGNPNTGKSTLFNRLTGLRQHVGNWPGKTVARMEGGFRYSDKRFKIVDLPGAYSLLSRSADEQITRDFLLFAQPDVTVVILDATSLERNLNLALQTLEITERIVVAVNLMDEAKRLSIKVDTRQLARELGVPVVGISARSGEGVQELLQTIFEVASGEVVPTPVRTARMSSAVECGVTELARQLEELYPGLPNVRWLALRLLEGDETIEAAVRDGSIGDLPRVMKEPVRSMKTLAPLEARS